MVYHNVLGVKTITAGQTAFDADLEWLMFTALNMDLTVTMYKYKYLLAAKTPSKIYIYHCKYWFAIVNIYRTK